MIAPAIPAEQIHTSPTPETIPVTNPITGEMLGTIPVMTANDVKRCYETAKAAQPAWEALGVKERGKLLGAWAEMMWRDRERIISILRAENGKTEGGAFGEIIVLDNIVHYYRQTAPKLLRSQKRRVTIPLAHRAKVVYHAYGVIGFVTPWNYPLQNGLIDAIAALIAGNAVLIKPSEITPFAIQAAVELMHTAGIPMEIAQIVTGDGRTGAALTDVVDYISVTGSTATGRKVAVRAAERLIPCSLELGGKAPSIVLADADLDIAAAMGIVGAFENAGQVCVSSERVYVEDAVYESYLTKLQEYAARLVLGSEGGMDVHVGSLTNERELRRTETQLQDALDKGAKVIVGGKRRPDLGPLFFEPTILVDVDHTMACMREETFGPLMPIMRVKDTDEALRFANETNYGLTANIFTRDIRKGEALAKQIQAGDVTINHPQYVFGTPDLPMGGMKDSGIGRRDGKEGLLRFVKVQSVFSDNNMITGAALTHYDPNTIRLYSFLRRARKWLPFL
jgi:acyl-CoA reductase-like NAD-dependent aldehyde dehydrogenase